MFSVIETRCLLCMLVGVCSRHPKINGTHKSAGRSYKEALESLATVLAAHTYIAQGGISDLRESSSGSKSGVFPRDHHELQKFTLGANQEGVGATVGGSSVGGSPTIGNERSTFGIKRNGGGDDQTSG